MCWYIDIVIDKVTDVKEYNSGFIHQITAEYQFDGAFPRFRITRNHCLCGIFQQAFDRSSLMKVLERIAGNPQTKRIQVVKYWNEPSTNHIARKVEMTEFRDLFINNSIDEGVCYQFMDKSKFQFSDALYSLWTSLFDLQAWVGRFRVRFGRTPQGPISKFGMCPSANQATYYKVLPVVGADFSLHCNFDFSAKGRSASG